MQSQTARPGTWEKLPDTPGVYFFLKTRMNPSSTAKLTTGHGADKDADRRGLPKKSDVLYIGRATSLRNRVRSYFDGRLLETRGPWLAKMLPEIRSIDFKKTDSVLEAIFLEADLIKKFQPRYNTDEKDDKSFNCVVITKEKFPRVLIVRKKDIDFESSRLTTFPPASRRAGNVTLKTIFGPFPHGLQLRHALKILRRIFPWRDAKCSPAHLFPEASNRTSRGDNMSRDVQEGNDTSPKRWAGKPCPEQRKRPDRHSNIPTNIGTSCRPCFNRQIGLCPGVCTGEISAKDYRKHIRRLSLFMSGKRALVMKELRRDMKQLAKQQKFEEADARKRTLFALKHIQDVALLKTTNYKLRTTNFRIEAYDLSHFGGKEIVGAMAVVEDGFARSSEYRLFKIRGVEGAHEVRGLQEMLRRRFNHPEWKHPDCIVVDGNDVQKRAAEDVLLSHGLPIPVIALVKDEKHRPRELLGFEEALHRHPSASSHLRQSVLLANSEAHRFVLKFQKNRRGKSWQ